MATMIANILPTSLPPNMLSGKQAAAFCSLTMRQIKALKTRNDPGDFLHAGEIQQDLEGIAKELAEKYVAVSFDIRERRESRVGKSKSRSKQKVS